MKKKGKKYLIIILLLLVIILLFFGYFKLYQYCKSLEENTPPNIGDLEEKKDEEEVKYLYKIVYTEPPNRELKKDTVTMSIFFIDKDYHIYSIQKTLTSDELAPYTKKIEGGQTIALDELRIELEKETPKEKMKLNRTQKFIVKTLLEEQLYIDDIGKEFFIEQPMYYIINSNDQKNYFSNFNGSNSRLEILLRAFIYNDATYFDYLKNNNVTNFIKDKEYQELDIQSELIKNLYQKVTIGRFDFSHYQEGKMTNNSIITWAIYQYYLKQQAASWTLENLNEKNFDRYVKQIFGKNMAYDMDSYTGTREDECVVFSKYRLSFNSGCEEAENIYSDLVFAYEKDDQLILIEKSLFYAPPYLSYSITGGKGLYTDANAKVLITNQYPLPSKSVSETLELYREFVTYYSYTFAKSNDGNYYLTDFNRLN